MFPYMAIVRDAEIDLDRYANVVAWIYEAQPMSLIGHPSVFSWRAACP
jgi:hypothetical protein